jgi:hypothetical protein
LTDHDKNINLYLEKNREAINRFLPINNNLQEQYKKLVLKILA